MKSQMEEGHKWFSSSPCAGGGPWGGSRLAHGRGPQGPVSITAATMALQHSLVSGQPLVSKSCLRTPPWAKGVLLQRVVISAGISEEGEGTLSDRLPLQIIESVSEIEAAFKLRVFVILLHLVSLGVTGGCRMVEN